MMSQISRLPAASNAMLCGCRNCAFDAGPPSPENPAYHLFMLGETAAAGMTPITPEMGPMRSVWGIYFNVKDCDASLARAVELGGAVTPAG